MPLSRPCCTAAFRPAAIPPPLHAQYSTVLHSEHRRLESINVAQATFYPAPDRAPSRGLPVKPLQRTGVQLGCSREREEARIASPSYCTLNSNCAFALVWLSAALHDIIHCQKRPRTVHLDRLTSSERPSTTAAEV